MSNASNRWKHAAIAWNSAADQPRPRPRSSHGSIRQRIGATTRLASRISFCPSVPISNRIAWRLGSIAWAAASSRYRAWRCCSVQPISAASRTARNQPTIPPPASRTASSSRASASGCRSQWIASAWAIRRDALGASGRSHSAACDSVFTARSARPARICLRAWASCSSIMRWRAGWLIGSSVNSRRATPAAFLYAPRATAASTACSRTAVFSENRCAAPSVARCQSFGRSPLR